MAAASTPACLIPPPRPFLAFRALKDTKDIFYTFFISIRREDAVRFGKSAIGSQHANVRVGELQPTKVLSHLSAGIPKNKPKLANGTRITVFLTVVESGKEVLEPPGFFIFSWNQELK